MTSPYLVVSDYQEVPGPTFDKCAQTLTWSDKIITFCPRYAGEVVFVTPYPRPPIMSTLRT